MLRKWLTPERYRRVKAKRAAVLVPVTVSDTAAPKVPSVSTIKPVAPMACEIVLPRGIVRVNLDQAGLRSVIAALSA